MSKAAVYTAFDLSDELKAKVEKFISEKNGNCEIGYFTDKTLLGGIKIVMGDIVYDGTVRRKLDIIEDTV